MARSTVFPLSAAVALPEIKRLVCEFQSELISRTIEQARAPPPGEQAAVLLLGPRQWVGKTTLAHRVAEDLLVGEVGRPAVGGVHCTVEVAVGRRR